MQSILSFLSYLSIATLLLVFSELMIKQLIRGLESALEFFFEDREKTLSFSLFNRSQLIWKSIFSTLWILSGILFSILIWGWLDSDFSLMFVIWFYFMSELRFDRSNKYIQQLNSRIKWTANWQEFDIYRSLIETENPVFVQILNDPEKLTQLELTTRHVRNAVTFDPKEMRKVKTREEIESRLKNHLGFLMSESSSVTHSIEEIYVILFMLSEYEDRLAKVVEDILLNEEILQLLLE